MIEKHFTLITGIPDKRWWVSFMDLYEGICVMGGRG